MMKHAVLFAALATSLSAFASEGCRPIYEEPVRIVGNAKSGPYDYTFDQPVMGNKLSPVQPAEKIILGVGEHRISLIPVASCERGLKLDVEIAGRSQELLAEWDRNASVEIEHRGFVNVTAHHLKP